jgi:hypothetical protein
MLHATHCSGQTDNWFVPQSRNRPDEEPAAGNTEYIKATEATGTLHFSSSLIVGSVAVRMQRTVGAAATSPIRQSVNIFRMIDIRPL